MSSLSKLESRVQRILKENVSSGDFKLLNFKPNLNIFLDNVTKKFPSFANHPEESASLIASKVDAINETDFISGGKLPTPHPKRIWDSIEEWVAETWPNIEVPPKVYELAFSFLQEYQLSSNLNEGVELDNSLAEISASAEAHSSEGEDEIKQAASLLMCSKDFNNVGLLPEDSQRTLELGSIKRALRKNPQKVKKLNLDEKLEDSSVDEAEIGNGSDVEVSDDSRSEVHDDDSQMDAELDSELSRDDIISRETVQPDLCHSDLEDCLANAIGNPLESAKIDDLLEMALHQNCNNSESMDIQAAPPLPANPLKNPISKLAKVAEAIIQKAQTDPEKLGALCLKYLDTAKSFMVFEDNKLIQVRVQNSTFRIANSTGITVEMRSSAESSSSSSSDENSEKQPVTRSDKKKAAKKDKGKSFTKKDNKKVSAEQKPKKSDKQTRTEKEQEEEIPSLLDNTLQQKFSTLLEELKIDDKTSSFLERLMKKDHVDEKLFQQFCLSSQNLVHKPMEVEAPVIDYMPKQFLQTWFDPSLGNANKDDLLNWLSLSMEAIYPTQLSIIVYVKLLVFVLATVLKVWGLSIQTELTNSSAFTDSQSLSQIATKTNSLLLEKLAKHAQFEKLCNMDLFPRNFYKTSTPRQTFRTCKSEMLKFLELCRLVPALLFCDLPYSTIIRFTPSFPNFTKSWETFKQDSRAKDFLHKAYFAELPLPLSIPSYLLQ